MRKVICNPVGEECSNEATRIVPLLENQCRLVCTMHGVTYSSYPFDGVPDPHYPQPTAEQLQERIDELKAAEQKAEAEHQEEVRKLRGYIDAWKRIARQRAEALTASRKALDNTRSVLARTLLVVGKQAVTIDVLEADDDA